MVDPLSRSIWKLICWFLLKSCMVAYVLSQALMTEVLAEMTTRIGAKTGD